MSDIGDSDEGAKEERNLSPMRYILTDFAKGMFFLAAGFLDVFLVFQIYVWFPSAYLAVISIVFLVVASYLEYRLYRALKRSVNKGRVD